MVVRHIGFPQLHEFQADMKSLMMKTFAIIALSYWQGYAKRVEVSPDQIVVTFKNPSPIDNRYTLQMGVEMSCGWVGITATGQNWSESMALPGKDSSLTIQLRPADQWIILRHYVNCFDYFEYLAQKGDSLHFMYQKGIPVATVSNRKTMSHDLNIDHLVRNILVKDKYTPVARYIHPVVFGKIKISSVENGKKLSPEQVELSRLGQIAGIQASLAPEALKYLKSRNRVLDSLRQQNALSDWIYDFEIRKKARLEQIIQVQTGHMPASEVKSLLTKTESDTQAYPDVYLEQFLEAASDQFYTKQARYRDIKDGTNKDYRQIYAGIDTSDLFLEKDKNYLLTREINRIHASFSREDFLKFFKQYEQKVTDSLLVGHVRKSYALDFDSSRNETGSVVLAGLDGKRVTFDDIKKRHKGKIIYVDFWASWCGPCRQVMPASAGLRQSLQTKNVVFVYLSIDNTIKQWQMASAKEKLDKYSENYLIINHKTSEFLKKNKLNEIPRYMIFDKTGRLIYANAPRVESSETGLLLTRLAEKP